MIANYRNKLFNANLAGDSVILWVYDALPGESRQASKQRTYYEKIVDLKDVSSVYDVKFEVNYHDKNLSLDYLNKGTAKVVCTDEAFVEQENFKQSASGKWVKSINLDDCQTVIMKTTNELTNTVNEKHISLDDCKTLWSEKIAQLA